MGVVSLKAGVVKKNFAALRAPNNTNPPFKILDPPLPFVLLHRTAVTA